MKLTLDVNHPIAQAIRRATADIHDGQAILRLTVSDRDFTATRTELTARVMSWSIVGSSGRHARETEVVFDVEFLAEPFIIPPYTITDGSTQRV